MRLLKILLQVMMFLTGSVMALADYNPSNPAEPGTPKVPHTLTLTLSTPGVATLYGAGTYTEGTRQRVYIANIKTYYTFVNWTDQDGEVVSTSSDFYYVMPDKKVTLTANFTYNFTYNPSNPAEPGTPHVPRKLTLTSSHPGAATLYGAGTYNEGSSQRVYLTNVQNYYTFVNWTDDEGKVVSTSRDFQYVMPDRNVTLTANFTYDYIYNPANPAEPGTPQVPRKLTLTSNYPGAATLYGAGTYNEGTTQRVYLSNVQNYYTFVNWTNEIDSVVSTSRDFQFVIPGRNVTLTANFTYDYVYDPANPAEPGPPAPAESVADNMVNFPRFGMYDDTHVMILCETPGSTIYYTLDGTDPTNQSSVYTAPIYVSGNILVKAVATKEGMENSPIRSYQVTTYKTAAPKFTFANKKIEISSDTEGAVIRYSIGTSDPDQNSTVYTTPITPEDNYQIRAYASKEGLSDSNITTYLHRIADYSMAAPTFSLDDSGKLVITSAVEGGTIRYTTDGTDPTSGSTAYTAPLVLNGNCTVKAFTTHVNYYDSPISEYKAEGFKVERPTFSFLNPKLSFTTATQEAQIRYTMDGSIPNEESTLYTDTLRLREDCHVVARGFKSNYEPSDTISFRYVYKNYQLSTPTASIANRKLVLKCSDPQAKIRYSMNSQVSVADFVQYNDSVVLSNDCTIRFYATRENYNDSPMDSIIFKKSEHQVAKPLISYTPDTKTVSITTDTNNAQIRYTTDGTVPTATTGNVYTGPFTVEGNLTITAVAFRSDLFDSEPEKLVIDSQKVPTPTASFANRQLTLRCADEAALIHYTTDANAAKGAFNVYEGPLALISNCTVRFYATRDRFNDSDIDKFEFVKSDHQVAKPAFGYNSNTKTMTITTATTDAQIRYTTDGSIPTATTGTLYSSPFAVEGNLTITAVAFRNDLFDSEPNEYVIDSQKVPTPTKSFANRQLTLNCEDDKAEIRYSTEDNAAKDEFNVYKSPINMTEDCNVRFYAKRELFNDSDMDSFEFNKSEHQEATPKLSKGYRNRTITVEAPDCLVELTINGIRTKHQTPATIDVTPDMESIRVVALARNADRYDSEPVEEKLVFHLPPAVSYDGHTISVSVADSDPA
ncbi:MAG: chitobiase/beta-hexosaminidase C-terminal domain-containing protein, partial [Muribaculum sp.]|nr:chitobiase/beta-hexosaminidase C-terminal domain-containing protein [Muribaculum sp.]